MLAGADDSSSSSATLVQRSSRCSSRPQPLYAALEDYRAFVLAYICRAPWSFCLMIFLGPAVTVLAERDVGSGGRVLGAFRPASLVPASYVVMVVVVVVVSPVLGAFADHSKYRKHVIAAAFIATIVAILLCASITESNYLLPALCMLVGSIVAELSSVAINSYLPEITPSYADMSAIVAEGNVKYSLTAVVYAIVTTAINAAAGFGTANQARIAAVVAVVVSAPGALRSIQLFGARPPIRDLREGESLWTIGFKRIAELAKLLRRDYPEMTQILIARSSYFGMQRAMVTLAATYLVAQIKLSAGLTSVVLIVAFVMGVPGAWFIHHIAHKNIEQRTIVLGCLYVLTGSFFLMPFLFYKASHVVAAFIYGGLWGFMTGALASIDKAFFSSFIPGGMESELFGMYAFTNSILEWLPPLIFTGFNEGVGSLRWALLPLSFFYIVGIVMLSRLDVDVGRKRIVQTLEYRRMSTNMSSISDKEADTQHTEMAAINGA